MANKTLFQTTPGRMMPAADAVNEAGGPAYRFTPEHALAQYAATGCLHGTFYAAAGEQLDAVLTLCDQIEPRFIARTALFARQRAHMKDLPALLGAVLAVRDPADQVFELLANVAAGRSSPAHWGQQIEAVAL